MESEHDDGGCEKNVRDALIHGDESQVILDSFRGRRHSFRAAEEFITYNNNRITTIEGEYTNGIRMEI